MAKRIIKHTPDALEAVCAFAHLISHTNRAFMKMLSLAPERTRADSVELVKVVQAEMRDLLDRISSSYSRHLVGHTIHSCVKLLATRQDLGTFGIPEGEIYKPAGRIHPSTLYVFTFVRDNDSKHRERSRFAAYPLRECTAFRTLNLPKCDIEGITSNCCYCPERDLKDLYDEGEYKNPSSEFWKDYRSCLVFPIRWSPFLTAVTTSILRRGIDPKSVVAGFLALDCMEAGVFGNIPWRKDIEDMPLMFNLGASLADSLYWPLHLMLKELEPTAAANTKPQ